MATVPSDKAIPPRTHITGTNHKPDRIPVDGVAIERSC
jgi:hypothetical protein